MITLALKKLSLAIVLLLVICSTTAAQQSSTRPEDGTKPYLSVFVHRGQAPNEKLLLQHFRSDPSLMKVAADCHFRIYDEFDPLYKERHSSYIPVETFPCVMLQRSDGGVVYKASGLNVPAGATELFDQMAYYAKLDPMSPRKDSIDLRPMAASEDCPDGKCPVRPTPQPDPMFPNLRPNGPALPDTSELIKPVVQPVRNSVAAAVWIAIGLGVLFLVSIGSVVVLVVLYVASKVLR